MSTTIALEAHTKYYKIEDDVVAVVLWDTGVFFFFMKSYFLLGPFLFLASRNIPGICLFFFSGRFRFSGERAGSRSAHGGIIIFLTFTLLTFFLAGQENFLPSRSLTIGMLTGDFFFDIYPC
jgi:hypothetical protein